MGARLRRPNEVSRWRAQTSTTRRWRAGVSGLSGSETARIWFGRSAVVEFPMAAPAAPGMMWPGVPSAAVADSALAARLAALEAQNAVLLKHTGGGGGTSPAEIVQVAVEIAKLQQSKPTPVAELQGLVELGKKLAGNSKDEKADPWEQLVPAVAARFLGAAPAQAGAQAVPGAAAGAPAATPTPEEADAVVASLDADTFAVFMAAAEKRRVANGTQKPGAA